VFYKNARIYCSDFAFHEGAFEVVDGKFGAILPDTVPEDAIDLGGQMAEIRGGVAKLVGSETIACSASNLWTCLTNAISWGVPEEEAIRAATYNPACAIGADQVVGSIAPGKRADFLVCSENYTKRRVFLAGKEQ